MSFLLEHLSRPDVSIAPSVSSSLTLWTHSQGQPLLMCCSVHHSWLGDGCKSTDNMTFSLTDDGQEGHYYELLAKLSADVTLWLYGDADVFLYFLRMMAVMFKNWPK